MAKSGKPRPRDVAAMIRRAEAANRNGTRAPRLFACASGRLIWHLFTEQLGRPSVEIGERYADGRADWGELFRESRRLDRGRRISTLLHRAAAGILMPFEFSTWSSWLAVHLVRDVALEIEGTDRSTDLNNLSRDIFGDPGRAEPFDPNWSTPAVVDLAHAIHEGRDFDALPMLGDALEEAGCGDSAILDHCRTAERHARGCWVLDGAMGLRRPTASGPTLSPA